MTKKQFDAIVKSELFYDENADLTTYAEVEESNELLFAMIGRISYNFQNLEEEIKEKIIRMLNVRKDLGEIVVSELSFKNKMNLFASLYLYRRTDYHFNAIAGYEEEYFYALIKAITKCEELRNQILHSMFEIDHLTDTIIRKKVTSKSKNGLRRVRQKISIPRLFHIADYIVHIEFQVSELFIDFEKKSIQKTRKKVLKNKVIARSIFE